jgi:DNA-directed RNA polymerase subunit RPC12/RpoP
VKISLEKLYHYKCDNCDRWWTIADIIPQLGKLVNCPHCGLLNTIEEVTEHPVAEQARQEGLEFSYKNWKGETRKRRVKPIQLEFTSTEWHPEHQWLLVAIDLDKQKERRFAVNDIQDEVIKSALLVLAPVDLKTPLSTDTFFKVSAESLERLAEAFQFKKFYYSIGSEPTDDEEHRSVE